MIDPQTVIDMAADVDARLGQIADGNRPWDAARRRRDGEQVVAEVAGEVVPAPPQPEPALCPLDDGPHCGSTCDGACLVSDQVHRDVTDPSIATEGRKPSLTDDGLSRTDRHAGSRVDWSTFWDRDDTTSDWLCEPFLANGRGHALYAPAKTGKSLFTLAVVAALATGRPVLNQPAGPPVNVLYLDLEMTEDDLYERLDDLGYGPNDDLSHLHYYVLPSLFPLDGAVGGEEVVDMARAGDDRLVVIETTARATSGKENDADTLRAFYSYTGRPLKAEGRALLRTDHAGKDAERGQRGTSAKADDVDVVWKMGVRDGGHFHLEATHRRMNWVPANVDLLQLADPLRYVTTTGTWPDGTAEVAKRLDAAGVPIDAGRPTAQQMLTDAGFERGRTLVLAAAMRYRRAPNYMGTAVGNSANDLDGNSEAEQR